MKDIDVIDWSDLHDSILNSISIDWESGVVQIFVTANEISAWKGKDIIIVCGKSTLLHQEHVKPWGDSVYVNEVSCHVINENIHINIEMQSGDNIIIECQSVSVVNNGN